MANIRIGDLFELEKGSLQSSKCTEGEFNFITASKDWKTHNEFSHDKEALIFAAMASGSLGRTHYVNGQFITSDLCYILIPKDSEKYPMDLKFYHFVFNSLKEEIVKNTKSGTSKEAINQTNLRNHEIPYFDIKQQHLWIEKLLNTKTIKEYLVLEIENQQTLLKKLRQSILQEAIEGKLTASWREQNPDVESASILLEKIKTEKEQLIKDKKIKKQKPLPLISEDEMPFDIPDNWKCCRLQNTSNNIHYGFNASAKPEKLDVRMLRITDIQNNSVNWNTVPGCDYTQKDLRSYSLSNNDILIARTGGTIGKSYIVKNISVVSLFASYLIRVIPNSKLNADFLKLFIESPSYWTQLYEAAWGAGQPNVNGTSLSKLILALPPLEEQKEIVKKIESLFKACDELETQINNSKTNSQTLMQAVLKEAFEMENKDV
ncbi:MAG: restriction endonuclease subunit S [Campylobacterota bacterium]|nr:restriction endonuclease subunit S [Campylobacterota bacterium]